MKKIVELIAEILGIKEQLIKANSFLQLDLRMDRKDLIQVITGLEDEYDIIIDYALIEKMHTVDDLNQCVNNILAL